MILDTDGSTCLTVDFGIGGGTATRQWDIMVQFLVWAPDYTNGNGRGGGTVLLTFE